MRTACYRQPGPCVVFHPRFAGRCTKCGLSRQEKSCALCDDYPCQTLSQFLANVPTAKDNLEVVRRTRHD